ncbi:hypothetical protein H0H92_006545 [Tricholoma furcatifolium]|nr:hypothetical protein H0H92_006545 [Tricholoma furcatifolium]
MERLCDEVIQIIFYELDDPGPLSHANKRFHHFSQDPYVRAHYFLTHYGPMEAMFQALGHGGVLTERVLDILISSGAHISRYLVQVAMHHYFHTASHFIKTSWVRNVPFGVFTYFLKVAEGMYGDIPRAKDPLMVQFPLALAVEPQLLPYAAKNGFFMDLKMFERTGTSNDTTVEEIVHNVRELCRLDPTMFVSRTVAAEVCMEAKSNVAGYRALKVLDKSRDLRFELGDVVEELIKVICRHQPNLPVAKSEPLLFFQTFVRTRSICSSETIEILRLLYADYPSSDHTARLVMLIIFFNSTEGGLTPAIMHTKLEALGLLPVTKKDVFNVLLNPFITNPKLVMDYATSEVVKTGDGRKGMSTKELKMFVGDVISRCLEMSCKGRLLDHMKNQYSFVEDLIKRAVQRHRLTLEDLPSRIIEPGEAYTRYEAKLSQDHTGFLPWRRQRQQWIEYDEADDDGNLGRESPVVEANDAENDVDNKDANPPKPKWGHISQETLSTMIKRDEVMPARSRRRIQSPGPSLSETSGKLPYPSDFLVVGLWIKKTYGSRSLPTAIFMTHAVINNNYNILEHYLPGSGYRYIVLNDRVPITLHHFKLLAHLGQRPSDCLYFEILKGCEFFFDEYDYLNRQESPPVKTEGSSPVSSPRKTRTHSETSSSSSSSGRRRKRPRRSATAVASYVVPGSDDDEDLSDNEEEVKRSGSQESNILKWIEHLGELLKEEQRKLREKKRKLRSTLEPGAKPRVYKTDFHKSLTSHLRDIRASDEAKKATLHELADVQDDYSDDDDDEYLQSRTKKRKTNA